MSWFKFEILKDSKCCETLMWLVNELKFDVICYTGYEINNCTFYMKSLDDKSTAQNSGVSLEAESLQFSTSKDQNHVVGSMTYYGVIQEMWEVDYIMFTIPLFKCKWVDNKHTHTNTDTHTDINTHTHTDTYKHTHRHIHIHTHTHIHTHRHTHTKTHTHTQHTHNTHTHRHRHTHTETHTYT